jgi:hypothetical protein
VPGRQQEFYKYGVRISHGPVVPTKPLTPTPLPSSLSPGEGRGARGERGERVRGVWHVRGGARANRFGYLRSLSAVSLPARRDRPSLAMSPYQKSLELSLTDV